MLRKYCEHNPRKNYGPHSYSQSLRLDLNLRLKAMGINGPNRLDLLLILRRRHKMPLNQPNNHNYLLRLSRGAARVMLIIKQIQNTHPPTEWNKQVRIQNSRRIQHKKYHSHLNSTPLLSLSLSLQSPSQAKKAEHSHSTTQRNTTDLRSKPQCASLISWSEVTSLSLSLLLFGFHANWKLCSSHYGVESISIGS